MSAAVRRRGRGGGAGACGKAPQDTNSQCGGPRKQALMCGRQTTSYKQGRRGEWEGGVHLQPAQRGWRCGKALPAARHNAA